MKLFQALCLILCIGFLSCRQNTNTQQEETTSADTSASEIINPKPDTATGGHDYTFLTHQMLHYNASSTVGKDIKEQPYADQWIDLESDGTYKAGKFQKQTHTGKWDYNHERKILQLRPDDSKLKTTEWQVMHNEDMVVFVGTRTFGDNATQIKLTRSDKFPE